MNVEPAIPSVRPPGARIPESGRSQPSPRPGADAEGAHRGNGRADDPSTGPTDEAAAPSGVIALDPELRDAFLSESADLFERIETLVLNLDRQTDPSDALHELGRCFHTLKGAAGSVGLIELAQKIHELEDHLERNAGPIRPALVDPLHDALRYLDGVIRALGTGPGPSVPAPPTTPTPTLAPARAPAEAAPVREVRPIEAESLGPAAAEGPLRVPSMRIDELLDLSSELITRRGVWTLQAESMREFALQARTCRNRLLASIERFHDLGLAREGTLRAADPKVDLPGLIRNLSEQAEDLAALTEIAQTSINLLAETAAPSTA